MEWSDNIFIEQFTPHSPEQKISDPLFKEAEVEVIVKREDLIHPLVSGNKWRKLKYNLIEARATKCTAVLSFGGAFSNHIYALAAAGRLAGIKTMGFIRGEEVLPLNPTLSFAVSSGMELHYMDRESYRKKNDPVFLNELQSKYPNAWIVPEGGSNFLGVKGCEEILSDIENEFDVLCTAVGSGGTMAGLIAGAKGGKKVVGFSALKGDGILNECIQSLIPGKEKYESSWSVQYDYHFGGYGKIDRKLIDFCGEFEQKHGIPLEPIYTGKMFYGVVDLIKKGYFSAGTRIMALHTGGLQGLSGLGPKIQQILQQKSVP